MTTALSGGATSTVTHRSGKGQVVDVSEFTGIAATSPVHRRHRGSATTAAPSATPTTATRGPVDISAAYRLLCTTRTDTYDPAPPTGDKWAVAVVAYLPK